MDQEVKDEMDKLQRQANRFCDSIPDLPPQLRPLVIDSYLAGYQSAVEWTQNIIDTFRLERITDETK